MDGNNPILYIHPKANEYTSFGDLVTYSKYVEMVNVPCDTIKIVYDEYIRAALCMNSDGTVSHRDIVETRVFIDVKGRDPRRYFKPLDILWTEKLKSGIRYNHVGIYLGDGEVCQIIGSPFDKKGVRITDWSGFIDEAENGLFAYRPIIPFKHFKTIASQIDWAADRQ